MLVPTFNGRPFPNETLLFGASPHRAPAAPDFAGRCCQRRLGKAERTGVATLLDVLEVAVGWFRSLGNKREKMGSHNVAMISYDHWNHIEIYRNHIGIWKSFLLTTLTTYVLLNLTPTRWICSFYSCETWVRSLPAIYTGGSLYPLVN